MAAAVDVVVVVVDGAASSSARLLAETSAEAGGCSATGMAGRFGARDVEHGRRGEVRAKITAKARPTDSRMDKMRIRHAGRVGRVECAVLRLVISGSSTARCSFSRSGADAFSIVRRRGYVARKGDEGWRNKGERNERRLDALKRLKSKQTTVLDNAKIH